MWRRVALEEDRLVQRMASSPIDPDSPRNNDKQRPHLARSLSRRSPQHSASIVHVEFQTLGCGSADDAWGSRVKEAACAPLPFSPLLYDDDALERPLPIVVDSSCSQGRYSATESVQGQNVPGSERDYDHGADEVGPPGEAESCSSPTTPFDPSVGADRPL